MPKDSMAKLVRQKMDEMSGSPSQRSKDYDGPMAIAVRMATDFRGLADEDKRAFLVEMGKLFPLPVGITKGLPFKLEYIPDEKEGE